MSAGVLLLLSDSFDKSRSESFHLTQDAIGIKRDHFVFIFAVFIVLQARQFRDQTANQKGYLANWCAGESIHSPERLGIRH